MVETEYVPMSELKSGDRIHNGGMIIVISDPHDYARRCHSGCDHTARHFKGVIVNDYHPFGWKSRDWAIQSIPSCRWHREV